jgi:hypothetical protein
MKPTEPADQEETDRARSTRDRALGDHARYGGRRRRPPRPPAKDKPKPPAAAGPQLRQPVFDYEAVPWTSGTPSRVINWMARTGGWPGNYPSFELQGPDPQTRDPQVAVAFWLTSNAKTILEAASRWNVDALAIATPIAWEALENPAGQSIKAVGPGKVHLTPEKGQLSWPEMVERSGRSTPLSPYDRTNFLATTKGAIDYIGAIMDIIAEITAHYGWDLRRSPAVLTYVYHSKTPNQWLDLMSKKKPDEKFHLQPGTMGEWVEQRRGYLQAALSAGAR